MRFHSNRFKGFQITEWTWNSITIDEREITSKIYKAQLWLLSMKHRLIVFYNCMKFHLNRFNGFQLTELTRNSIANNQREITHKISKVELWFLFMTNISLFSTTVWSYNQIALTVFNSQSGHDNAFTYVPMVIIWKIYKQELWFLCMTLHLNVHYKCMKFR